MAGDALVPHQLFGGAIEIAFPSRLADVSDFRDVPDSQEVYTDASADQSLIVEVVEHQPGVPDDQAALFFLNDLAVVGGAAAGTTGVPVQLGPQDMPGVPAAAAKSKASAVHVVAKGRQDVAAANSVQVLLANVRLPGFGSDLLITLNTPIFISGASSAAEQVGAGAQTLHTAAPPLFADILRSLRIVDWGLFGDPVAP